MLKTTKSISLNGTSIIKIGEADTPVVSMSANIQMCGHTNVNTTIVDQEKYDANKETCRADIDAFTAYVREIEDSLSAE